MIVAVGLSYLAPVIENMQRKLSAMFSGPSDALNDDIALARAAQEIRLREESEVEAKKRAEKEIARKREKQREYEEENNMSGGRRLGDGRAFPKAPPRGGGGYNPLMGGGGGGGGGGFRPSDRRPPGGGG